MTSRDDSHGHDADPVRGEDDPATPEVGGRWSPTGGATERIADASETGGEALAGGPADAASEAREAGGASERGESTAAGVAGDASAAAAAPPPPVELWSGEMALDRHVPEGPPRARLQRALTEVRAAVAAAEAGCEPLRGGDPPARLADLVTAAGRLAEPLAEAFAACDPAARDTPPATDPLAHDEASVASARGLLGRALAGWILGLLATRLGVVARRHGRSLVPSDLVASIPDFAERHVASARTGHGVDPAFLRQSLPRVRAISDAAWGELAGTDAAVDAVPPALQRSLVVLLEHARARLIRLEHWHYETCLVDPPPAGVASWRIALTTRVGRPAWRAPLGPPPRPVIDDVTEKSADAAPAADPAAGKDDRGHDHRSGRDTTGPADRSAQADDAA